jgi:signal transduction histidine kinase
MGKLKIRSSARILRETSTQDCPELSPKSGLSSDAMNTDTTIQPIQILHLEDSLLDHEIVLRTLRKSDLQFEISRVEKLAEFTQAVLDRRYDVILADYRLPGFTALDAWQSLVAVPDCPPFILLSGAIGEAAAVDAIKLGMSDYLLKDDIGKLAYVIARAIEVNDIKKAKERADTELIQSEQRLVQFAEHLQTSIEQERSAIAREIHDDIGGSLAAIKFDLAWIGRHHTDPATLSHLDGASAMLQHAIGASQRIMMNLRPAILDQGLEAAIEWLAREFEKRSGIKIQFHASLQQVETSKAIALTAYRTAQEALTNIGKHAQCTRVRIELSDAEAVLTLEITDNGQGIAADNLDKPNAFGLKGLQERARTVGGWLDVSSRLAEGTSITLSIPLTTKYSSNSQDPAP